MRIESVVRITRSYDATSTLAQTRAATAAASSTAALPVSVRRKLRSGVSRFRTQAVRPENGGSRAPGSVPLSGCTTTLIGLRQYRLIWSGPHGGDEAREPERDQDDRAVRRVDP